MSKITNTKKSSKTLALNPLAADAATLNDAKNALLVVSLVINALFLIGYVTLKVAAVNGYAITIPL